MSCNSNCYLPIPPRAWSRVQNSCSLFDENTYSGDALVPLPYSGRLVPASTLYLEYAMLNKGNVLQYKKNSSNLTKQQRYAQIAKGKWVNRNTTWATQSTRGYTNPNNQSLQRVNSVNITLDGQPTLAPVTCPKPFTPVNEPLPGTSSSGANPETIPPPPPPPTTNSGTQLPPAIIEPPVAPVVIPDLGNLVCGTQENVCTGQVIKQPTIINCHPTSDSDVPGPLMELCWNDGNPTWYPRQRYIMTNSGNKWPDNYKLLVSAISIPPPVIVSSNVVNNEITLTWTQDERCIPATEFTIYENGIPVKIVPGTTFTTTILIASGNGEYVFYIISSNSTIISEPSNSITVIINNNNCYYSISGNYFVTEDNISYTITFNYSATNSNFIKLGCAVNNISITIVGGGGGGGKGANNFYICGGGGGGGGGGIYSGVVNFSPDTYNIVVGNKGLGSTYDTYNNGRGGDGGNSYIQNSSLGYIGSIAIGGLGGSSTQSNQSGQSSGGVAGGPISGGYGGKGGNDNNVATNGDNGGLFPYSGGGGGGGGGTEGNRGGGGAYSSIGGTGAVLNGANGGPAGASYGGGGGGGGCNGGYGGEGREGVIKIVIPKN
jgi:hypothetical protein